MAVLPVASAPFRPRVDWWWWGYPPAVKAPPTLDDCDTSKSRGGVPFRQLGCWCRPYCLRGPPKLEVTKEVAQQMLQGLYRPNIFEHPNSSVTLNKYRYHAQLFVRCSIC
jgi:hypothetical protein